MEAVEVYQMYCALKAHFGKSDYDFVKYNGKSSVTKSSFWKRNDRHFFVRTSRKYKDKDTVKDYLLSNFIKNQKGWLGDFSDDNYMEWKKRMQSLTYTFKEEMLPLVEDNELNSIFEIPESSHPKLLKEYLGNRVSIEAMVILDDLVQYTKNWDKKLGDDVIWPNINKMIKNYKKFLTFDKNKCKMVLITLIKQE
tara:strand:- start:816 stop:1400 length:585 start_codon:yes stop_codon:yes gene_type:complete